MSLLRHQGQELDDGRATPCPKVPEGIVTCRGTLCEMEVNLLADPHNQEIGATRRRPSLYRSRGPAAHPVSTFDVALPTGMFLELVSLLVPGVKPAVSRLR